MRQWSTLHPEFSYLPRKFKIAVTGSPDDRAAVRVHDIGLRMWRERGRRDRLRGDRGRRPRPHADDRQDAARVPAAATSCSPTSRRSCASTTATAGATTSTRRGSRSWSTRSAPRRFARRSRPSRPRSRTARWSCPRRESSAIAPPFRAAGLRRSADRRAAVEGLRLDDRDFALWLHPTWRRTSMPGYAHRHRLAEAHRRHAGRCQRRQMDGVADLADALQLRRDPGHPRAEPGLPHVARAICPRCGARSDGSASPTPTSA